MTRRIVKIVGFLLVLLILVYVVYQVFMATSPSYKTQVALVNTVEDTVPAPGVAVRDEQVIEGLDSAGVYNYLVDNGDKVAKGSIIAEIYADSQDALDNLTLAQYQHELDILKQAVDQGRTAGTNIDSLTSRIHSATQALSAGLSRQDYSALETHKLALMELLNSYDVASGNALDVEGRISYLEQQVAALSQSSSAPTGYVTAPSEGYFISALDGMESAAGKRGVLEMSVDEIIALAAGGTSGETGCKLVADYVWYYAAVIDQRDAERFSPGMSLMLDFSSSAVESVPVQVVSVKTQDGNQKAAVIVSCTRFNADVTELRFEDAVFSFRNYKGFIIERSWLHMEDGVLGVYVKYGSIVQFRRVDVVYETQTYVVSRSGLTEAGLLSLYDEIITQGRDLYVGKDLGG